MCWNGEQRKSSQLSFTWVLFSAEKPKWAFEPSNILSFPRKWQPLRAKWNNDQLKVQVGKGKNSCPYLVKAGKRIVLPLLCYASPVVEYGSIPASWVGEGHPLPGPHPLTAQLGFDSPVALGGVAGKQRGGVSVQTQEMDSLVKTSVPNNETSFFCAMFGPVEFRRERRLWIQQYRFSKYLFSTYWNMRANQYVFFKNYLPIFTAISCIKPGTMCLDLN